MSKEAIQRINKARETGVRKLDLSSLRLKMLPSEIVQLTNLTSLHLNGNQLATLPPVFGQLTKLTWLNLALVPGANLLLDPKAAKAITNHLDLMSKISVSLLSGDLAVHGAPESFTNDLSPAEGAGLRTFHHLLHELDPAQKWGGLRRVVNQSGDILWVCPEHYTYYDQGFPDLSG